MSYRGIIATLSYDGIYYRVTDYLDDYEISVNDNISPPRYFSGHQAMTQRADIALALSSYIGVKILQRDIVFSRAI